MVDAQTVYGRVIRTPVLGPFVRLPLRLARWFWRDPDRETSTRLDALAQEFRLMQGQLADLASRDERRGRLHDHHRLHLSMLSAMIAASQAETVRAGAFRSGDAGREPGSREAALRG